MSYILPQEVLSGYNPNSIAAHNSSVVHLKVKAHPHLTSIPYTRYYSALRWHTIHTCIISTGVPCQMILHWCLSALPSENAFLQRLMSALNDWMGWLCIYTIHTPLMRANVNSLGGLGTTAYQGTEYKHWARRHLCVYSDPCLHNDKLIIQERLKTSTLTR